VSKLLSPKAATFLLDEVQSIERLETLLLMYRRRADWESQDSLARDLLLAPDVVQGHLEGLAASNLLDVRVTDAVRYQFAPTREGLDELLDELSDVYRTRREELVAFATEAWLGGMQRFADAFRLKRRGD
jgi:hypothetical protein